MFGPNITGSTGYQAYGTQSGAFYRETYRVLSAHPESEGNYETVDFSATLSNPIYKEITTVQPSSLIVLACIKT